MSIHSEVGPAVGAYWAGFGAGQSREQFFSSWLSILCSQIGGVTGGLLLVASDQQNTFVPAAAWPDHGRDLSYLGPVAKQSLGERKGTVARHFGQPGQAIGAGAYLACPVLVSGELKAVVVLDITTRPDEQLQQALRLIHWGNAWLVDLFRQQGHQERDQRLELVTLSNALMASALQERSFKSCAMVVVNELARKWACERVSLGFEHEGLVKVEVISNTANFDPRANLSRLIAEAMDEVLDAAEPLCHPAHGDEALIATGQTALADESGAVGVLSVPLVNEGRNIGVLTLERNSGAAFDASERHTGKVLGVLLGPILALKRDNERGVVQRGLDTSRDGLRALFGPRHGGVKLVAMVVCVVLIVLSLATGDYRVVAKTLVEGEVQRATAAPFDGYIAQAYVNAGDVVHKGQLLARLEDRDLKVEQARWTAEREQYLRKHRQAQANNERASMNVLNAQADQADAQLQLIEDRLARAKLLAPFDGVIVAGDLRQLIGTPVEQGKVLFETAPLDAFRVVLQVDEREIGRIVNGQTGDLVLSGIPGEQFKFTVKQITPVAVAEDGRNYFRVEARMEGGVKRLRPGMEGIGKISAGRHRLIWIWTHSLVEWLKISLWTWLP